MPYRPLMLCPWWSYTDGLLNDWIYGDRSTVGLVNQYITGGHHSRVFFWDHGVLPSLMCGLKHTNNVWTGQECFWGPTVP